jgi:hypothetical protein
MIISRDGRGPEARDHSVKQFREEEFRQNGISPRAQSVIPNAVAWAERMVRHVDGVFGLNRAFEHVLYWSDRTLAK